MKLIETINRKFVLISNRLTKSYEKVFSFTCDIYFPINGANPNSYGNYDSVNPFGTQAIPSYNTTPHATTDFIICNLFKKESMNTAEDAFDNFYLENYQQPFIETSKEKELPLQTKVVVHNGTVEIDFSIERKQVVNGTDGSFLLRMYLNPLAKG